VLCLCGLTRNSKDFHHVASRLADAYRVICPDYRGRGRSEYAADGRTYHPLVYLQDVRHLMVSLDIGRFAVIGTSLGGLLAMALGPLMPTALCGVLLNDVGPRIVERGLDQVVAFMRDHRPLADWPAAVRRLREAFPDLPADDADGWMRIARSTYREGVDGRIRQDWDPKIVEQFGTADTEDYDLWALFRSLARIPVTSLRGERSTILDVETWERMADVMPSMERVAVPRVGHAPGLDEPESRNAIDRLLGRAFA
jgi:pimeloyl-ACP methyl ester carboxylesterase